VFEIAEIQSVTSVFGILSIEAFDSAGRIHQLLLAGKKRVALGTDFQVDFRFGRPRLECLAASAFHDGLDVSRVNIRLHESSRLNAYYKLIAKPPLVIS
jgi:hypothetical protein